MSVEMAAAHGFVWLLKYAYALQRGCLCMCASHPFQAPPPPKPKVIYLVVSFLCSVI